jgi:hypothetical protein
MPRTDFRADRPKTDVLVLHGDADQVLLLDKIGKRLPGLVKDVSRVAPMRSRGPMPTR